MSPLDYDYGSRSHAFFPRARLFELLFRRVATRHVELVSHRHRKSESVMGRAFTYYWRRRGKPVADFSRRASHMLRIQVDEMNIEKRGQLLNVPTIGDTL